MIQAVTILSSVSKILQSIVGVVDDDVTIDSVGASPILDTVNLIVSGSAAEVDFNRRGTSFTFLTLSSFIATIISPSSMPPINEGFSIPSGMSLNPLTIAAPLSPFISVIPKPLLPFLIKNEISINGIIVFYNFYSILFIMSFNIRKF